MISKADDANASLLFDAESLGASFRELAVDVVRGETTEFISRWYRASRSDQDADLMIWTDGNNRVIKHQLSFYGQVVEWSPIHGTRTGLIIEVEAGIEGSLEAAEHFDSDDGSERVAETIRFDLKAQDFSVDQAVRILAAIPELTEETRSKLIFNLRESPKLHRNARERAMKAWSPQAEELISNGRPGFWRRLKSWVTGG